jgi:hypothetical protein
MCFMYNCHAVERSVCSPDDTFIGKKSRKILIFRYESIRSHM